MSYFRFHFWPYTNLILQLWKATVFFVVFSAFAWLHPEMKKWEKLQHTCSLADLQRRGPWFAVAQGAGGGTAAGKQSSPPPDLAHANTHPRLPHLQLCPSPGENERERVAFSESCMQSERELQFFHWNSWQEKEHNQSTPKPQTWQTRKYIKSTRNKEWVILNCRWKEVSIWNCWKQQRNVAVITAT